MSYRTLRDLEFVEEGGPGTIVCPAGTVLEDCPAGSMSFRDASDWARMVGWQPNVRLVAVVWRGKFRALRAGIDVLPVPARRTVFSPP